MLTLYFRYNPGLLGNDVGGLRPLLTLSDVKRHFLAFFKGFETAALNFFEVNKDIGTAVILGDKSKAFRFIKPFHCAGGHCAFL